MVEIIAAELFSEQKTNQSVSANQPFDDYFTQADFEFTEQNVSTQDLEGFAYVQDIFFIMDFDPEIVISFDSQSSLFKGELFFTVQSRYNDLIDIVNQEFKLMEHFTSSARTTTLGNIQERVPIDDYVDQPLTISLLLDTLNEGDKFTFDSNVTFDVNISIKALGRKP